MITKVTYWSKGLALLLLSMGLIGCHKSLSKVEADCFMENLRENLPSREIMFAPKEKVTLPPPKPRTYTYIVQQEITPDEIPYKVEKTGYNSYTAYPQGQGYSIEYFKVISYEPLSMQQIEDSISMGRALPASPEEYLKLKQRKTGNIFEDYPDPEVFKALFP